MKKVPMTFYTCNANHITNMAHDVAKHKFDVIHITEAGLKGQEPTGMTGYKAVKLQRKEHNRGSVIWVRESYLDRMVRVYDPEDDNIGSEVIHLQMDTIPPTTIIGVY